MSVRTKRMFTGSCRKLVCKHRCVYAFAGTHFARISIEINVSPNVTRYVQIEVA